MLPNMTARYSGASSSAGVASRYPLLPFSEPSTARSTILLELALRRAHNPLCIHRGGHCGRAIRSDLKERRNGWARLLWELCAYSEVGSGWRSVGARVAGTQGRRIWRNADRGPTENGSRKAESRFGEGVAVAGDRIGAVTVRACQERREIGSVAAGGRDNRNLQFVNLVRGRRIWRGAECGAELDTELRRAGGGLCRRQYAGDGAGQTVRCAVAGCGQFQRRRNGSLEPPFRITSGSEKVTT